MHLLNDDKIVFRGGQYRYVDHTLKLVTTGYMTREAVIKNKYIFRFDEASVDLMRCRYQGVVE